MSEVLPVVGLVFGSVRLLYWLAAGIALLLVIWLPKVRWLKVVLAVAVVAAFSYLPIKEAQETYEVVQYRKAAWALFENRCKRDAGEKIYKTADNIDGVFLMKPRPKATVDQLRDQYWMGDPYGHDNLEVSRLLWDVDEAGIGVTVPTMRKGFQFVEAPDVTRQLSASNPYVRYNLDRKAQKLVESSVFDRKSVYGLTWDDISTREDRAHWIAGGRLQIVDLRTNEVLAERIGYVLETGFGSHGPGGGRTSWEAARTAGAMCPAIPINGSNDRLFVTRVLKPTKENSGAK